jgi:hypothetical protein
MSIVGQVLDNLGAWVGSAVRLAADWCFLALVTYLVLYLCLLGVGRIWRLEGPAANIGVGIWMVVPLLGATAGTANGWEVQVLVVAAATAALPWAVIFLAILTDSGPAFSRAWWHASTARRRGRLGEAVAAFASLESAEGIKKSVLRAAPHKADSRWRDGLDPDSALDYEDVAEALAAAAQARFDLAKTVERAGHNRLVPEAVLLNVSAGSRNAAATLWSSCDRLSVARGPTGGRTYQALVAYTERVTRLANVFREIRDDIVEIGINGATNDDLRKIGGSLAKLEKATNAFEGDLASLMFGNATIAKSTDASSQPEPSRAEVERSLDQAAATVMGRLPDDQEVFVRVASIRLSIRSILQRNPAVDVPDPMLYSVRQTALSYLPDALARYLQLPTSDAKKKTQGVKSAHDMLVEQLDLLDDAMREASDALSHRDTDRLAAHGRFLADKFQQSGLSVNSRDDR